MRYTMTEIHNLDFYVLLVFDERYLFIPQHEVESVEIIADVQRADDKTGAIGWFYGHKQESPVFCLDEDLSLLPEIPSKREYFVLLKNDPQPLGILCDEVENINFKQAHLRAQELPLVMKTPNSPLRELLVYQDKMGCLCSGAALVKHLLPDISSE